jgi:hypothetical protein
VDTFIYSSSAKQRFICSIEDGIYRQKGYIRLHYREAAIFELMN